ISYVQQVDSSNSSHHNKIEFIFATNGLGNIVPICASAFISREKRRDRERRCRRAYDLQTIIDPGRQVRRAPPPRVVLAHSAETGPPKHAAASLAASPASREEYLGQNAVCG